MGAEPDRICIRLLLINPVLVESRTIALVLEAVWLKMKLPEMRARSIAVVMLLIAPREVVQAPTNLLLVIWMSLPPIIWRTLVVPASAVPRNSQPSIVIRSAAAVVVSPTPAWFVALAVINVQLRRLKSAAETEMGETIAANPVPSRTKL